MLCCGVATTNRATKIGGQLLSESFIHSRKVPFPVIPA
jgi:hypothetical protein